MAAACASGKSKRIEREKPVGLRQQLAPDAKGHAGNADTSRGASAVINASRVAFTLSQMTDDEAKDNGVAASNRRDFVRLDDAKGNYSRNTGEPEWFEKKEMVLPNGERSAAIAPARFSVTGPDHVPPEQLEMVAELVDEISISGAWTKGSSSPRSRQYYLPRIMADRDDFFQAGMTDRRCEAALAKLVRDGRVEIVSHGRAKTGGPPPRRYRSVAGAMRVPSI